MYHTASTKLGTVNQIRLVYHTVFYFIFKYLDHCKSHIPLSYYDWQTHIEISLV